MVWTCLRRWPLLIAFAAISPSAALAANDSLIPVLDTGTQLFSNVTVTSKSITHVFIKHSRGFAGRKINELSHDALVKLGLAQPDLRPVMTKESEPAGSVSSSTPSAFSNFRTSMKIENPLSKLGFNPKITVIDRNVSIEVGNQTFLIDENFIKGIFWCLLFGYVLFCYCAMLICRKAGLKAGISCWVPILQWISLFRAAGMSGWNVLLGFVLAFVPLLQFIVPIRWSIKICQARGKGIFCIICMLLPTWPFAFLYLALSTDGREPAEGSGKVQLSYQTSAE